eukprot:m.161568 g.161568  ORF g.161568 m.161568 type:complete len:407 (+) comp23848_c0_seq2:20-1240(+)
MSAEGGPSTDEPVLSPGQKSKKPARSQFRQQQLPAWRPILTPVSVLPIFVSVGIAFIITGGVLLAENRKVKEEEFEYTKCVRKYAGAVSPGGTESCYDLLENNNSFTDVNTLAFRCECELEVRLKGFADKKTYIYYGLENFYQNHRRYVKSRSDRQLRAAQLAGGDTCEPLLHRGNVTYAPCGLIANSLFNDTIQLRLSNNPGASIPLSGEGIAWKSDLDVRFKNPDTPTGDICDAPYFSPFSSTKPPNWGVSACQLGEARAPASTMCDTETAHTGVPCVYNPWFSNQPEFGSSGRGYENEDLVVWMRVAALPNFRKPWRIAKDGIPDDTYKITVGYNFPVAPFDGKKKIIFTTTNSIGGDNPFVAGCYITIGVLSLVSGIGFFIFTRFSLADRKLGDVSKLSWDH